MNELDKIFQSKLENHTAEYSEQSWNKIQSRLVNQKSKPKKYPWFWMSLVAIILVGVVYLWSDRDDTESSMESKNPVAVNKDTYHQTASEVAIASNQVSTAIGSKDELENIDIDNELSIQLDETVANGGEVSQQSVTRNDLSEVKSTDLKSEIEVLDKTQRNRRSETRTTALYGENVSSNSTSAISSNSNLMNEVKAANTEVTILHSELQTTNTNRSVAAIMESTANETKIRPLRTIGVSAYTTLQSERDITDIELSTSMLDDFRQDCPSFVTDRTGVYLDFYISHELPFSNLKAKTQELEPYQALRSGSEGPTYSFSAGARLTLMLPNGLGLKTGLNYSQVNEKFTYVDDDTDMVKEVITITTVGGMEVRDTNVIVIPGTRDVVSTNKYRSFDIPLLLSYEWDVRERTYMTVNGGAYLNLLFKESGKILSPNGEVIDIADSSGDKLAIFKNNIGLSLFGSVGLHYRMTGNIDLIVEPNVRLLVKSATVDAYSIEHKWFTAGLITGLRYNF